MVTNREGVNQVQDLDSVTCCRVNNNLHLQAKAESKPTVVVIKRGRISLLLQQAGPLHSVRACLQEKADGVCSAAFQLGFCQGRAALVFVPFSPWQLCQPGSHHLFFVAVLARGGLQGSSVDLWCYSCSLGEQRHLLAKLGVKRCKRCDLLFKCWTKQKTQPKLKDKVIAIRRPWQLSHSN